MSATVVLEDRSLEVVPGETLRVAAVVTNTGSVVDAVRLDVVGVPEGWGHVEPPEVRLLPGRKTTVELVVAPPRLSSSATGLQVLGLRAQCREDPDGGFVEEAVLEVLPFSDVAAELVPRSRRARGLRKARFVVAVDNRGNAPVDVELDALDPDQALVLAVSEPRLTCLPGTATFGTLLVRAQRRYWRGLPVSKGFVALVRVPGRTDPVELPGTLGHEALIPMGLPRLATRAALLAAAALVLLLLVVPAVKDSAAKSAQEAAKASVEQAVGPVTDTVTQAAADADAAKRSAEQAQAVVQASAGPTPKKSVGPTGTPVPAPGKPVPFTARLQVSRESTGPFLRIGVGQELTLAGFVLQPNGDRGEMALRRNGVELVTARLGDTQVFDFPAPVLFGPASSVQLTVVCRNPADDPCDTAVLLTGTARSLPVPTPTPSPGGVAPAPAASPEPTLTAEPLDEPTEEPSPTPSEQQTATGVVPGT